MNVKSGDNNKSSVDDTTEKMMIQSHLHRSEILPYPLPGDYLLSIDIQGRTSLFSGPTI